MNMNDNERALLAENETLRLEIAGLERAQIVFHVAAEADKAENGRLREALEWIASNEPDPFDSGRRAQLEAAVRRARAALTCDGMCPDGRYCREHGDLLPEEDE